jgi:serine/threonine protein kinase
MAPEQFTSGRADARSDVYAVGLVLFEMLTGREVFQGRTAPTALMHAHREDPVPSPRSIEPGLPKVLDELVLRALAKSPADRPASAADMAAEIRTIGRRLVSESGGFEEAGWFVGRTSTPHEPIGPDEFTADGTLIVDRDALRASSPPAGTQQRVSSAVKGEARTETAVDLQAAPDPEPKPAPRPRHTTPRGVSGCPTTTRSPRSAGRRRGCCRRRWRRLDRRDRARCAMAGEGSGSDGPRGGGRAGCACGGWR